MKNIEKIAQNPEKLAKFIANVDCSEMDCKSCIFSEACLKTDECNDQKAMTDWLESEAKPSETELYTQYVTDYLRGFVQRRMSELQDGDYSWVKCPPLSYERWKELLHS